MASRSLHHPADTRGDYRSKFHVIRNRAHPTSSAENWQRILILSQVSQSRCAKLERPSQLKAFRNVKVSSTWWPKGFQDSHFYSRILLFYRINAKNQYHQQLTLLLSFFIGNMLCYTRYTTKGTEIYILGFGLVFSKERHSNVSKTWIMRPTCYIWNCKDNKNNIQSWIITTVTMQSSFT